MTQRILIIAALLPLLLLRACGQVITRVTPTPPDTPTLVLAQAATQRPTATPAPYTPAPTATPTVTPTPIIYKLKFGDSLLAIAGEFGTTVQAIQDANGITNPAGLMAGQEIVIPQPAGPPEGTQTPTVTATPMAFDVANVAFNRTPLGGLWCFGEIHNTSGTDLEQASVMVTLLDEQRQPLAQVQTDAIQDLIPPGGRAPFAARFAEPPVTFASYQVSPATGVRGYLGGFYRDLSVRNVKGEGERYSAYTVQGEVINVGPEDTVGVQLTITLYDSLGRVIAARRVPPEHNVIPRGGQTSFRAELTPAGGPVAGVHVEALGRRMGTPTPVAAAGPDWRLQANTNPAG